MPQRTASWFAELGNRKSSQFYLITTRSADIRVAIYDNLPALGQGIFGLLGSTVLSATGFLVGIFFGLFILLNNVLDYYFYI